MKNWIKALLGIGIVGGGIYLYTREPSIADKRAYLKAKAPEAAAIFDRMTDAEISDTYSLIVDYQEKGKFPEVGSQLQQRLTIIGAKYNIFT